MLTTLRAYSSARSVDTLLLAGAGRAETDFLQVRSITGLDPVDASINTVPFGTLDGDSYSGSSVGRRNIVMTVKPNPDWVNWTYEKLRRLLYTYFLPKSLVRLVFETDEIDPVEIFGYVESIDPDIFSRDGEIQISVICPYPHFTEVTPTITTGIANASALEVDYDGSVETGINLKVTYTSGGSPYWIYISSLESPASQFEVVASVDANNYFVMNSVPGNKYAQTVNFNTGVITNHLADIIPGSEWLTAKPGPNSFFVNTDVGVQDWTITYYKKYGGL